MTWRHALTLRASVGPSPRTADSVKPPRRRSLRWDSVRRRTQRAGKQLLQEIVFRHVRDSTVLFIVGCQRSGTDLMTRILDRDLGTKVYPEVSVLSSLDQDRQLRLNPIPTVKARLARDKAPLIVLKPLVESQNAGLLLDSFSDSRALWLFRDYRAVANSHVSKWGGANSIRDLRDIVEARPASWRYENVSQELRATVIRHFSEEMDAHDAAALYWYVRNRLYFDLGFDTDSRFLLCNYETLVASPVTALETIYGFVGRSFPGPRLVTEVHAHGVAKGSGVALSPEIEEHCAGLQRLLESAAVDQWRTREGDGRGDGN